MKKFLKYTLFVAVSVFVLDYAMGYFLDKNFSLNTGDKSAMAYGNHYDIALMGASEMGNQYVTSIVCDSLGVTAYNYGSGGQNIYYQYALLNLMINHAQKPKCVLLEMSYIDFYDTPRWNTEKLDALYPLYEFDDSLQSVVDLQGWRNEFLLRSFRCYKHNSQILTYVKNYVSHEDTNNYLGYSPIEPVDFSDELERVKNEADYKFDKQKIEYLYRFIHLCKANDITLIVVNAPSYEIHDSVAWIDILKGILAKESIPFLNYDNDKYFTSHREWYYNRVHFNKNGAEEYTRRIIPDIKKVLQANMKLEGIM